MFKYLLPAGIAALLLGALALSAQVRDEPAPSKAPKQPAAASNKSDTVKDRAAPASKAAHRRGRSRVYLGVYTVPVEDMSRRVKKRMQIKEDDGVIIVEVMPDSPADEAGLRHGDVITHVNGKLVDDEEELSDDLNEMGPGKSVPLSVVREGKKIEVKATLEEGPGEEFGGHFGEQGGGFPGAGAPHTATAQDRLKRLERLERKVSRLEKRLDEATKSQPAK